MFLRTLLNHMFPARHHSIEFNFDVVYERSNPFVHLRRAPEKYQIACRVFGRRVIDPADICYFQFADQRSPGGLDFQRAIILLGKEANIPGGFRPFPSSAAFAFRDHVFEIPRAHEHHKLVFAGESFDDGDNYVVATAVLDHYDGQVKLSMLPFGHGLGPGDFIVGLREPVPEITAQLQVPPGRHRPQIVVP